MALVPDECTGLCPRLEVPYPDDAILPCREHESSVRRGCDGDHQPPMPELVQQPAGLQVPEPDRPIIAAGDGAAAVGQERNRPDFADVAEQRRLDLAGDWARR